MSQEPSNQEVIRMQPCDYSKLPVTPEEDQAMAALSRKLAAQQQQDALVTASRPRPASKPMPRVNRIG